MVPHDSQLARAYDVVTTGNQHLGTVDCDKGWKLQNYFTELPRLRRCLRYLSLAADGTKFEV